MFSSFQGLGNSGCNMFYLERKALGLRGFYSLYHWIASVMFSARDKLMVWTRTVISRTCTSSVVTLIWPDWGYNGLSMRENEFTPMAIERFEDTPRSTIPLRAA